FAQFLHEYHVEIIATVGTNDYLRANGIPSIYIGEFTGIPEILGGRLKTLHPKIHAGLLALRDNKLHIEQMQQYNFPQIDLVVANPKPVSRIIEQSGGSVDELFNQIDIGGITMIRSAAKNFRYVTVVVDRIYYPLVMHEMRAHEGAVSFITRYRLAQEAFFCTSRYDKNIAEFLDHHASPPSESAPLCSQEEHL
ncbi:MAG: bifunctional phosphoribosylaminoimidazolecarboxamide formyltransferase/IMP cyclohydrolase, partial [Candidatus Hydrogenedens sp.]|nr:bifunctional phosphoribosylaminoimidazolecarboxamide formyltransferase/IMP cyclohydrolase [Candidatus Hydrogenedens sp.]